MRLLLGIVVLTLVPLFVDSFWAPYLPVLGSALAVFLVFVGERKKADAKFLPSDETEGEAEAAITVETDEELLAEEPVYEEHENEELEGRLLDLEEQLRAYKAVLSEFVTAVPMEKRLADVIVEMTETSTLELTEQIYALAEKSNLLGKQIREQLESLTFGESSLMEEIRTLRNSVSETKLVVERFQEIQNRQQSDMDVVSSAVESVGGYIATISELAEQTGILAINASIEAARAGGVGKGFAVIAGEVHKLADASRNVAQSIGSTLELADEKVRESFGQQRERIEGAIVRLERGQREQERRADILSPHIERLRKGVEATTSTSSSVQEGLDRISASLQSQDSVRQILEHMIEFLQELRHDSPVGIEDADSSMQKALEGRLSKRFTTRAEWNAFGLHLDESFQDSEKKEEEGDITLFS
ncbi:methyl-accepting chemotaxis protein [Sediminispirochaeta smaragdinae]|uniref:Methyl-accepting chemotaxis sensory transducer n=1 Tax=Sediminispirochaeta smaragdinae (strain DSM 11293 / JCM 15392 / SEBR 4228) TaxID=573413 RepID=E1R3P8_SEDSS|nr:methyl-accepting chemotaxis protein [Sediminispirochaeta smaragdinae]ADK82019.1 methyl-accepting chemotaxis sensory transducer [Sediminispirochaeta smaragdinae DSM 11293]